MEDRNKASDQPVARKKLTYEQSLAREILNRYSNRIMFNGCDVKEMTTILQGLRDRSARKGFLAGWDAARAHFTDVTSCATCNEKLEQFMEKNFNV